MGKTDFSKQDHQYEDYYSDYIEADIIHLIKVIKL